MSKEAGKKRKSHSVNEDKMNVIKLLEIGTRMQLWANIAE